jgi:hypothetical protein
MTLSANSRKHHQSGMSHREALDVKFLRQCLLDAKVKPLHHADPILPHSGFSTVRSEANTWNGAWEERPGGPSRTSSLHAESIQAGPQGLRQAGAEGAELIGGHEAQSWLLVVGFHGALLPQPLKHSLLLRFCRLPRRPLPPAAPNIPAGPVSGNFSGKKREYDNKGNKKESLKRKKSPRSPALFWCRCTWASCEAPHGQRVQIIVGRAQ